jgi:hypothetical protein
MYLLIPHLLFLAIESLKSFVCEDRWEIIAKYTFLCALYPEFHCQVKRFQLPLTFVSVHMRAFLLTAEMIHRKNTHYFLFLQPF